MKHRCSRQSTRTKGRSLAQAGRPGLAPRSLLGPCAIAVQEDSEGAGKQAVSLRNASQQELPAVASCTARVAGRTRRFGPLSRERLDVEAEDRDESYLVDPASSHMLVSKIKPCMSKYKLLYCETANGSLNQLSSI